MSTNETDVHEFNAKCIDKLYAELYTNVYTTANYQVTIGPNRAWWHYEHGPCYYDIDTTRIGYSVKGIEENIYNSRSSTVYTEEAYKERLHLLHLNRKKAGWKC